MGVSAIIRRPAGAAAASLDVRADVAAALSLVAAGMHVAVVGSHFQEWWAYGAFFLAAGTGQALFAPLILRRPRAWLVATGIAGNVAIVGLYVVTRTAGPPIGPHARVPEPAGPVDLATTAAEVLLVGVLMTMLGARAQRLTGDVVLGLAVLLWALRLTGHLP
jgi:hypothetical protein